MGALEEFYENFGSQIIQDSEKLFIDEFLYPIIGQKLLEINPQYKFIDSTGRLRRIDFVYHGVNNNIAFEIDGETYHAEGNIPMEMFDDNLFRQNEIINSGYYLVRFSYNQLLSSRWRPVVYATLRNIFRIYASELLSSYQLTPTSLQKEALEAISFFRDAKNWKKGVIVMPTGTGKTVMSALDALRIGSPILFLVHRLDILKQSVDAYKIVWPTMKEGILTGEEKRDIYNCDVLFASKDTLRQPRILEKFKRHWFNYIVVDEVHHGQSPTYREVISYFRPKFMIGMTATPDRTDRRDIFELFDYNKIYEISLPEAIERGFLVPFTYYGLTDNIDYSQIRYQNQKYRVTDLERSLIIPERNEAILKEYLEKGAGDKAIGFCVSIRHADRMAEFFRNLGITTEAIHSESPNRDELIKKFRENKIQVVFTVDLFNEGIDFPNVQVLLFLRPTESKTVFMQQLGRGLRLSMGKNRVRVLDFIGNYKRANQIRKYLSKTQKEVEFEAEGRVRRKIEYAYSTGCEVFFEEDVEEILDRQDAIDLGITKRDLIGAYYALAEKLGRKPSRIDLDNEGEFKSAHYSERFGSWLSFLREIGEFTEASYHYPQGTHLGHILSILKVFGSGTRKGTQYDDEYIRLRGNLGTGRISTYRRQVKYKLQAAMELGILPDDRNYAQDEKYSLELTPQGTELYHALKSVLDNFNLEFSIDETGIPTTRMGNAGEYNIAIKDFIQKNQDSHEVFIRTFLKMHAVQQMLAFLFHISRKAVVPRNEIYGQFFQAPFVKQFCDQEGIEEATLEASRRRCPFLLNILDACGIINTARNEIKVNKLFLTPMLVRPHRREEQETSITRLKAIIDAWPIDTSRLSDEDLSIVRELFGSTFLTDDYFLKDLEVMIE